MPIGGLFKFLSQEHVDAFISGSIRMGGFDTYSLLELISGDQWIGDKQESRSVTFVDNVSNAHVSIRGNIIISRNYGYCLSLSHGDIEQLSDAMANSDSPYRYDACIEIINPHKFMRRLASALDRIFSNFGKMGFEGRAVTYAGTGNEHAANNFDNHNPYDPFLKPEKYSAQAEYRIVVLMDQADQKHNYLQLQIGDLSDIVQQRKIHNNPQTYNEPFILDEYEARSSIISILESMKKLDRTDHAKYEAATKGLIYAYGCIRFCKNDFRHPELEFFIMMYELERRTPLEKRGFPYWWHHEIIRYIQTNSAIFT
jgi:hypothetical protein